MIYMILCISAEPAVKPRRDPPRIIDELRGINRGVD
jgi:hypothetical protein